MADSATLSQTRQQVTQKITPGVIEMLQQEAARNFAVVSVGVANSPHFQLWQFIKQKAATENDPTATYIVDMVRFGQGLRIRELLPVEDYFTSIQQQAQQGSNGNAPTRRNAPDREYVTTSDTGYTPGSGHT